MRQQEFELNRGDFINNITYYPEVVQKNSCVEVSVPIKKKSSYLPSCTKTQFHTKI